MVLLKKRIPGADEASLARFLRRASGAAKLSGTVNVLITNDREMRSLNRRFRSKDSATDVLSFPAAPGLPGGVPGKLAGDLAISADIAGRNARQFGHPVVDEIKILILHGVLHLAGYDHERDNGKMARKEARLRKALELPDSLILRSTAKPDNGVRAASVRRQKS